MTLERQARGFFQRMNDYVNGQSSNNQAALKLNRADLIGSMAGNRNTFGAVIFENKIIIIIKLKWNISKKSKYRMK